MERKIHLGGALAKKYGKEPILIDANTPQEIIAGLICRFGRGFREVVRAGKFNFIKSKKNKEDIGNEEVSFPLQDRVEELWFMPATSGAGAWARIIVGVVLVVVGFIVPGAQGLIGLGASLILGGVSQLLAPKPNKGGTDQAGQQPSFMFNGAVNVTEQGSPVPIVYGRVRRASSIVFSAGLTVENMAN